MPRAKLRVRFPESVWVGRLSQEHPTAKIRILAAIPSGAVGVALIEISGDETEAIVEEMADIDAITEFEILEERPEFKLVQFVTTISLLLDAAQEAGVPISLPLTIQGGEGTWEVTTSRERLAELGSQLETFGLTFIVESIYQEVGSSELLSENQWELIETALEMGYYDTPRRCTQYELADACGLARSTCSETLHRAESTIIEWFVTSEVIPTRRAEI